MLRFRFLVCIMAIFVATLCAWIARPGTASLPAGSCLALDDRAAAGLRGGANAWCRVETTCLGGREEAACDAVACAPGVEEGQSCLSFRIGYYPEECSFAYGNQYCSRGTYINVLCTRDYDCRCKTDELGAKVCSDLIATAVNCTNISSDLFNCSATTCPL